VLVWAIVLAAGSGSRFGGLKQFAMLGGRSLLDHVVTTAAHVCDGVVVTLPPGAAWSPSGPMTVVPGGASRAASVRNGLAAIPEGVEIVVVHDAAHPLAPEALFEAVIARVREGAVGAVPVLAGTEAIARVEAGRLLSTVPARDYHLVQTPHAFRTVALRALHADEPEAGDEASLFVARGHTVVTVPGDPRNIHVSTAADLAVAARLLSP
jgi:2-C-methyl-D-erythritol 4-phosphate cytidylyltransferase